MDMYMSIWIDGLEEENKKLKEENKRLKEENEALKIQMAEYKNLFVNATNSFKEELDDIINYF